MWYRSVIPELRRESWAYQQKFEVSLGYTVSFRAAIQQDTVSPPHPLRKKDKSVSFQLYTQNTNQLIKVGCGKTVLARLRQEDFKFSASWGFIVSLWCAWATLSQRSKQTKQTKIQLSQKTEVSSV